MIKYWNALNFWCNKCLSQYHKQIKYINISILSIVGVMFFMGGVGITSIPKFAQVSTLDYWFWFIVSYSLALTQIFTLVQCDCPNIWRWSNSILIISGLVLIIIGSAFGAKYPPSNWQMIVFPIVGFLFSLVGRKLNKMNLKGKTNGKVN